MRKEKYSVGDRIRIHHEDRAGRLGIREGVLVEILNESTSGFLVVDVNRTGVYVGSQRVYKEQENSNTPKREKIPQAGIYVQVISYGTIKPTQLSDDLQLIGVVLPQYRDL